MIETLAFSIALIGSSIAAAWDLKTTEIPDQIPYVMAGLAILLAILKSYSLGEVGPLVFSLASGGGLLALGFGMYWAGQWGGGDAKLLAALGFFSPTLPMHVKLLLPFPLSYLLNVFLLGAAYMLLYAVVIALLNREVIMNFFQDMRASTRMLIICSIVSLIALIAFNWYLLRFLGLRLDLTFLTLSSSIPILTALGLYLVWRFAKVVEVVGFRKRIPVKELKVGDVLLEAKRWDGLTEQEVNKIKNSGKKFVIIKEGVRFGLTFPLALIFTIYVGDGLLLLMGIS